MKHTRHKRKAKRKSKRIRNIKPPLESREIQNLIDSLEIALTKRIGIDVKVRFVIEPSGYVVKWTGYGE